MSTYPQSEPKRRGLALTIIGGVLMVVVAPVIFVVATVMGVKDAVNLISNTPVVPNGGTVTMTAGQTRDIYPYVGTSTSDTGVDSSPTMATTVPDCTVTDPTGQDVSISTGGGATTWSRQGGAYQIYGSFTASQAGEYKVTCGNVDALVPDGHDATNAGKKAAWGIGGGFIGASVAGLLGLILLIVGIVKLVNSGKERSAFRMQQQMGQWQQPYYY